MRNLHNVISLESALQLNDAVCIDVRSPLEYGQGHIPGAVNIPIFNDDERALVGTTYKVSGQEKAKQQGLSIVSPKLPEIVSQINMYYKADKKIIVYCWRGGMRSKSIVNILGLMGIPAFQLIGGYKSHRRLVIDNLATFSLKPAIVMLCGSTGVGKTSILNKLAEKSIPVLDLEKLANHRGSAFGQIGLGQPATAQNFDSDILYKLRELNEKDFIVLECESKRVGNVYVPDVLYQKMQKGIKILLTAEMDIRITRLINEYTDVYLKNKHKIEMSLEILRPRLGSKKTDKLLADLALGKIRDVVQLLLTDYYDPLYGYGKSKTIFYENTICANDLDEATTKIIDFLQQLRR